MRESKTERVRIMYINVDTVIKIAALITAGGVICSLLVAVINFVMQPKQQKSEIRKLRSVHESDIKVINEEQCLITYGLLACLKGLREQGCNGPVTEAISKIEKHLNKQAHDMED